MIREALGQISIPGGGWSGSTAPTPAVNSEKKKFDWDSVAKENGAKDKVSAALGQVGQALGLSQSNGSGKESSQQKEPAEIMIGMFVHTPWPSSEIFRCLPSELSASCKQCFR